MSEVSSSPDPSCLFAKRVLVLALSLAPVQAAGTDSQSLGEQGAWAPRMAAVHCLSLLSYHPLPFLRTALLWVASFGTLAMLFCWSLTETLEIILFWTCARRLDLIL